MASSPAPSSSLSIASGSPETSPNVADSDAARKNNPSDSSVAASPSDPGTPPRDVRARAKRLEEQERGGVAADGGAPSLNPNPGGAARACSSTRPSAASSPRRRAPRQSPPRACTRRRRRGRWPPRARPARSRRRARRRRRRGTGPVAPRRRRRGGQPPRGAARSRRDAVGGDARARRRREPTSEERGPGCAAARGMSAAAARSHPAGAPTRDPPHRIAPSSSKSPRTAAHLAPACCRAAWALAPSVHSIQRPSRASLSPESLSAASIDSGLHSIASSAFATAPAGSFLRGRDTPNRPSRATPFARLFRSAARVVVHPAVAAPSPARARAPPRRRANLRRGERGGFSPPLSRGTLHRAAAAISAPVAAPGRHPAPGDQIHRGTRRRAGRSCGIRARAPSRPSPRPRRCRPVSANPAFSRRTPPDAVASVASSGLSRTTPSRSTTAAAPESSEATRFPRRSHSSPLSATLAR